MRRVEVTPYDEQWALRFQQEAAILQELFRGEILVVHHIGSTSVPGLKAKPIIDMLPVVHDIRQVDRFQEALEQLGYFSKGEFGIPGRRYFPKGGDNRTHHVHFYQKEHPAIIRHLAFRDYLRAHPAEAHVYGNVKEELAQRFPFDAPSYVKGKESCARELEQKALAWCSPS